MKIYILQLSWTIDTEKNMKHISLYIKVKIVEISKYRLSCMRYKYGGVNEFMENICWTLCIMFW